MPITKLIKCNTEAGETADDISVRRCMRQGVAGWWMPRELTCDTGGASAGKINRKAPMVAEGGANVEAVDAMWAPGRAGIRCLETYYPHARGGDGGVVKVVWTVEAMPGRRVGAEGGGP